MYLINLSLNRSTSIDSDVLLIASIVFICVVLITAYNKYKQMKDNDS